MSCYAPLTLHAHVHATIGPRNGWALCGGRGVDEPTIRFPSESVPTIPSIRRRSSYAQCPAPPTTSDSFTIN